ncbi:Rrf2 family transcriptional regulator [Caproiciproducens sp. NJN-50]|uniref:Rrf2 family transcriptional regulator n=1 Tax=Acutalibacteraceae TaxID=3082771 RepID=UPI000FFE24D0|nr:MULTISPECIES: Rrf2 family transcriptional regulator [Acutalibacteraceae]QAT50628.1 Rrf2 family transcriptional regulator [Caproiciproducens sp. NJN-50]
MQLVVLAGDLGPKWFHVALRAMVLIARSNGMMTSSQLAEKLGCENTYLKKIMIRLAKSHLIVSYPGRYGGYSLGKPAGQIKVLDVYQALVTTTPTPYYSVPSTGPEYYISLIVTKGEKAFQSVLNEFTMEDLLEDGEDE